VPNKSIAYIFLALIVGACAGYALCYEATPRDRASLIRLSQEELKRLPTSELGRHVLARVGARFIGVRRPSSSGDDIRFFDTPKPYGNSLCRVNSYLVPSKIISGQSARGQDWWADDLTITRLYGIWKPPTTNGSTTREKACANYRDFDHLFLEQGLLAAERGAFLLDTVLAQAQSGKLRFPATCTSSPKHTAAQHCDPVSILRGLSLRNLRLVHQDKEQAFKGGIRWTDDLMLANPSGAAGDLSILIVSDQHFGRQSIAEADVQSVNVRIPAYH